MELLIEDIGLEALGREIDKSVDLEKKFDATVDKFYKDLSKLEDEIKNIKYIHSPSSKDTYENCLEQICELKNKLNPSQQDKNFERLMDCLLVELSPMQREIFRQVIILNKSNSQVIIKDKEIPTTTVKKQLETIRLKFSDENSSIKQIMLKNTENEITEITKTLRILLENKPINADFICSKVIKHLNNNVKTNKERKRSKESSLWWYKVHKNIEVEKYFKEAQMTIKQVKQDIEEKNKAYKYFEDAEELFKEVDLKWNKSKAYKSIKLFNKGAKITINRKLNDKTKYRKALRMAKDAKSTFNYDKDLKRYNQQIAEAEKLIKESEPDHEKILNEAKEKIIMYQELYDPNVFKFEKKASE